MPISGKPEIGGRTPQDDGHGYVRSIPPDWNMPWTPAACPIIPNKPQREGRLAHPHHRRGGHDRPQADRAAGRGRRVERSADRQVLTLHDVVRFPAETLESGPSPVPPLETFVGDLADPGEAEKLVAARPDVDLPSRRRRVGRGRARLRQGLSRQSRRHARLARRDPRSAARAITHSSSSRPRSRSTARRSRPRSRTISISRR